ncbi:MAG: efflux RND transporter periplasmic adaptor subunit [Syntrophomonas sp.]
MNKWKEIICFCCLLVFLSGCSSKPEAELTASYPDKENAPVVMESTVSGRAEAVQTVKVVSKQSGKVSGVYVDMGSEVNKEQVILELDARDLKASVDAARASLNSAQIAYKYALANQQRAEPLKNSGALSQADYDNNYLGVLERSKAAVDLAQASFEKALINYEDSTLKAPISGTVTVLNVKTGEYISSQNPAMTIINLDEVQIKLFVNENKINDLKLGQTFKVELPAIPGQSFQGKVTNISGAKDTSSKAYPVKITVENSQHLIKDGMYACVHL